MPDLPEPDSRHLERKVFNPSTPPVEAPNTPQKHVKNP
jgi:hypothetical protein